MFVISTNTEPAMQNMHWKFLRNTNDGGDSDFIMPVRFLFATGFGVELWSKEFKVSLQPQKSSGIQFFRNFKRFHNGMFTIYDGGCQLHVFLCECI